MANISNANGAITVTAPTEEIATKFAKKITEVAMEWSYFVDIETRCKFSLSEGEDGQVSVQFPMTALGKWTFEEAAKNLPNWAMEEGDFDEFKEYPLEMFISYTDIEPGDEVLYEAECNLVKEAGEDKFRCESFQMAEMEFNYENIAGCFSEDFADDCFLE